MIINPQQKIPEFVQAIDVESTDTAPTTRLLSISSACIKVSDLSLQACSDYIFDPKDPTQDERTTSMGTMAWWENLGPESWKPSKEAREITWGGHMRMADNIRRILKELAAYAKLDVVYAAKGPEFDLVILENMANYYGVPYRLRFSAYDSVRTAMRGLDAIGVPHITDEMRERHPLLKQEELRHTSRFDALEEGLIVAHYYHWLDKIRKLLVPMGDLNAQLAKLEADKKDEGNAE